MSSKMELIQIVDKNGNFTGEIIEKEKAHDKNLLHNEVAAFVVNKKGKTVIPFEYDWTGLIF